VGSPEPDEVPTITELVQRCILRGVNTRELERRSGGRVAHQGFDKLAQGDVLAFPKSAEVIEAQAQALGVDARQVVLGYAKQIGVNVHEDRSLLASMLPASAKRLTVRQSTVLIDLINEMAPATVGALDLSGHSVEELRVVTRLWAELDKRRPDAPPALAKTLAFILSAIDAAIENATPEG
jgi:hypothetical protein